jgi:uncharacterized membrane-anchored protein
MKQLHVPRVGAAYWGGLILASIFGANLGDLLADDWGWGHVTGLPYLAVALALILFLERFDRTPHTAYYWAAIIVVRAAATNIGDIGHDMKWSQPLVMAVLTVILAAAAWLWALRARTSESPAVLSTNGWYWLAMVAAGSLGTVLGDFGSGTLGQTLGLGFRGGNFAATALGTLLIVLLFLLWRGRRPTAPVFFWVAVVLIRAAGTAAGDALAHSAGLVVSTILSGLVFVALVSYWRGSPAGHPRRQPQ